MNAQAMQMIGFDWQHQQTGHPPRSEGPRPIAFGAFVAVPSARQLLRRGVPVDIGSRAFDLLMVLLRSAGEIVSKEEIVRHVWPSTIVDESNLRFQMTSLRKVLSEARDRIKTIPGRGYLFVADERDAIEPAPASPRKSCRPAIVIIDEDPDNREALHRLLQPFDAHIQSFVSVAAFLESSAAGQPR
jgi:DNA-binding winged helix-turn-helix (wHTH) protein